MKSLISGLVVAASLVLSSQAFAIKSADCPKKVKIQVSNINIYKSADETLKEIFAFEYESDDQIAAVRAAYPKLQDISTIEREIALTEGKGGVCKYWSDKYHEKIHIYTAKGKDLVYMQTELGPGGILVRSFASVVSMSPEQLVIGQDVGVALAIPRSNYDDYSAGGSLVFVAKAFGQAL